MFFYSCCMDEKKSFSELIKDFNKMYGLPVNDKPSLPSSKRLENFRKVLAEEFEEINKVIDKCKEASMILNNEKDSVFPREMINSDYIASVLTEMTDWIGDMIVYLTSESTKYGINMDQALRIIMDSNFSKLGADGKPIYDERGKVMKGPNYWKPEPKIKEFLKKQLEE